MTTGGTEGAMPALVQELLGSVTDLQFAEDAGLAQAEVSWQLPQAASEDVQVPENLLER